MPSRITLTATAGPLAGQQFVVKDRMTCVLGRAKDCEPRLLHVPEQLSAPSGWAR
jgi:eukaryotic-like serine/threonine-protein kinase